MAKRRKGHRKAKARAHRRRGAFGAGIHRPRVGVAGHAFRLRPHSPYREYGIRRVNRRHNPMLAEYLLGGNPRRKHGRRRHNPAGFGVQTLTNPMPLLVDAGSGLAGITAPIIVGNLIMGFVGPSVPMLSQPGIVGSAIRAAIRVGAAMVLDPVIYRIPMLDHGAYRVGAAIGIGGSLIMDLLGRPLILGPGDQALSFQYLFGGFTPGATAGQGAYFRRGVTGQGAYFRRGVTGVQGTEMGNINALVPVPRVGTRGVGAGLQMSPKTVDLFGPF